MERVKTLAEKLVEQINQGKSASEMMLTIQMLQVELASSKAETKTEEDIVVNAPVSFVATTWPVVRNDAAEKESISLPLAASEESDIAAPEQIDSTPEVIEDEADLKPGTIIFEATNEPEVVIAESETPVQDDVKETAKGEDEPVYSVLEIDEEELEAELEEIKRNAAVRNNLSAHVKPSLLFDPLEETPTLAQHANTTSPQVHEQLRPMVETGASLNERLAQARTERTEHLSNEPIRDLRKGIETNDRFAFINELFKGDEAMYDRSIKTINSYSIFPEAEYWIRRELKLKMGWDERSELVRKFDHLVKRRFSAI